MAFPIHRQRRLRNHEVLRDLVRETKLTKDDLIYPIFVQEGSSDKEEIPSMPGQYRHSLNSLREEIKSIRDSGLKSVMVFGLPSTKDVEGTQAWKEDGIVQRAIQAIKEIDKSMYVVGDVCFCQYTDHGHCGVIENEHVVNDATIENLAKVALSQARAGADMVAPSDMMDGRVSAIRNVLDQQGFENIPIMSYAAKFASSYYGPFRDAADGAPQFGDRKTYQMDYANIREAMREMELDLEEGADILMVKPALSYLDVITKAKERFDVPIACYNVSGEYAMIKAAEKKGWIDGSKVMMETLTSMKRAGASIILTYFAKEAASLIRG